MRSIETEGETIDAAIDAALRALGLERQRVDVEILASPTRGVLGFGGRPARIRATVRAPLASTFADLGERASGAAGVSRETASRNPVPASSADRPGDATGNDGGTREATLTVPTADAVTRATGVLRTIIELLGTECHVEPRPGTDPESIVLDVSGDATGLLIGYRGQTLDALEYMVNRIVGREHDGGARFVVDVERYRERRREYLDALARRLADKVKQTGKVMTLSPMTPRDRRIVHLALQGDDTVTTRSQGEGHLRKVVILPGDRGARLPRAGRSPV